MTRVFIRLPSLESPEDALDWCAVRGLVAPKLHGGCSVVVIGCAEVAGSVPAVELSCADTVEIEVAR